MSNSLLRILVYASAFSVAIPLFSTLRLRQLDAPYKILLFYLILGLSSELAGYYFVVIKGQNNISIDHYFRLVEGILLCWMYWTLLGWDISRLPLLIISLIAVRMFLNYIFVVDGYQIPIDNQEGQIYRQDLANTVFELILKVLLFICALYYYYVLFDKTEVDSLLKHGFFWINSAILFYFGVEMFVDTFREFMRVSSEIARKLFPIHLVCNLLFHAMLTIGIWTSSRR